MPRGVPNNGKRSPRASTAGTAGFEASMAGGALDGQARDEAPAEVQAAAPDVPADLIEIPTVELVDERDDEVLVQPEPVQPEQLTAEQEEIKRLRDTIAKLSGKKDEEPVFETLRQPGAEGNIVIHFLEDGLTALGQVWYRGQELEFEPGSRAYKDTFNRLGQTWLSLAGDDFAQVEKWGKVMFRPGPWPGKTYLDGQFEALRSEKDDSRVSKPTQEELERAEKLRQTRRSAPVLPQNV